MEHSKARIDTKLVHAGEPRIAGAVVIPVFQSTLYELGTTPGAPLGYHDIHGFGGDERDRTAE